MHDGDHDGLVRIFAGFSCELGGLINYLHYAAQFFLYQECNITRHNFSPTRSVTLHYVTLHYINFFFLLTLHCNLKICTCTVSVGRNKNVYTWYQEWGKMSSKCHFRHGQFASKIDPSPDFTSGFDPSPRKRSDFSTSVPYDEITGCHEGDGVRPRNNGERSQAPCARDKINIP